MIAKTLLLGAAAAFAIALAPTANAADFTPGDPGFSITGDIASGTVSASLGNNGIAAGTFTDFFRFRIDQTGVGSGSISTSTSFINSATDLDISSVMVNGMTAAKTLSSDGLSEFFNISNVPIMFGQLNVISVTGLSRGNGSYGGNATFTPAVPEPATWALMIGGFGAIGATMRRRKSRVIGAFA